MGYARLGATGPGRPECHLPTSVAPACEPLYGMRVVRRGTPRVLLADTLIEWRRDGSYTGLVHFDLAPGGQSSCQLRVPPKVKIVYLQTAGIMSPRKDAGSLAAAGGTLQVPLAIEGAPAAIGCPLQRPSFDCFGTWQGQVSTSSVGRGFCCRQDVVDDPPGQCR